MDDEKKINETQNIANIKTVQITALIIAMIALISIIFKYDELGLSSPVSANIILFVISCTVLLFLSLKKTKQQSIISAHTLLVAFVITIAFTVNKLPDEFNIQLTLLGLIIFIFALAFRWNFVNQIIVAVYSLIITALFVIFSPPLNNVLNNLAEPITFLIAFNFASIIVSFILDTPLKAKRDAEIEIINKQDSTNKNIPYKEILDSLAEGVYRVLPEGQIIYINEALAKMFGYENIDEFVNEDAGKKLFYDCEERQKLTKILMVQKRVKNYRIPLNKKDGSEMLTKLSERMVFDSNEKPVFIEGIIHDITQQAKADEDKKREIAELKTEKTKAVKDVNSAVYTSNIKAQFLASMSHEIKTPVNSIVGFLNLIEKGMFDSEIELKEFASNAKIAADALLEIINNMLDISKIEAGKMELDDVEFSIIEEVEKAKSIISPVVSEKKLDLNLIIDDELPEFVYGDPMRFRQVTLNILSNAAKYTDKGEIRIKLDLIQKNESSAKIKITILDTGRGIPEEKIPLLFKPYTQIKEKKWTQKDGSGLGLMISKEFVTLMGGEINITSEFGIGTTVEFTVILKTVKDPSTEKKEEPIIAKEEHKVSSSSDNQKIILNFSNEEKNKPSIETNGVMNKDDEKKLKLDEVTNPPASKKKKRLLLVEDNPISQKVEKKLLSDSGYEVETVSGAVEAINAVQTNTFDLVLMDVEMPEMDGITATQKIRELDSPMNKIPIIAVTAHSSMKDREKCLASGMNDYIAKPININFMKMTIDQWLFRSGI
ncbi:MAG: response regulator [Bacteroidetes bacterium]|nr:response regulator [Bacteroidota bacterium]